MIILRLVKKNHKSKQPIDFNLVDTKKIVISDRFKLSDDGFKYFTSNKEDNLIRLLFCLKWLGT